MLLLCAKSPVDPVNKTKEGVAIQGYDPVAYFELQRPEKGLPEHSFSWMGAEWRFANAAHRARFAAEPSRYAPRYGGYCAWAVSNNYTAPIDPQAWKIVSGKLYLNYSKSVQKKWEEQLLDRISAADRNWPALHRATPSRAAE